MPESSANHVTNLLSAARAGRQEAAAELLELVYAQLRAVAGYQMAAVPPGDTLQPTALVHEAYLKLFKNGEVPWVDRRHFFHAAARAMRDIVIDQARRHVSVKRGGRRQRIPLDEAVVVAKHDAHDLVAMDEALDILQKINPTGAQVAMLRFFAGLTVEETAQAMEMSPATVDRHWRHARAWLRQRIRGDGASEAKDPSDGV